MQMKTKTEQGQSTCIDKIDFNQKLSQETKKVIYNDKRITATQRYDI